MNATTYIDLLRHGEPIGGRRYRGQVDDPLSDKGWRQMWAAVDGTNAWDKIISSPLRRCSDFALSLGTKLDIPVSQDKRFQEVGFGAWEGKTAAELKTLDPEVIARFYHDPVNNRPTGAESLSAFSHRVCTAFSEVLFEHQGKTILIVAHAGVIRAVIAHVLQAPLEAMYRISVDTASLIRIKADPERPPTIVFKRHCLANA